MIGRLVEGCARRRGAVLAAVAVALAGAGVAASGVLVDALPDLAPPQVIVLTEWMGRSPEVVAEQVTAPLVAALAGTPGAADVRGESMQGMSFVRILFEDGAGAERARARVAERVAATAPSLPPGAVPALGLDAGTTGWVFQYVLVDGGGHGPVALRALHDGTIRPALLRVPGVAEVAGLGGLRPRLEVVADPARLAAHGLTVQDVAAAVRQAGGDASGEALEVGGREIAVQARGALRSPADLEAVAIRSHGAGAPVRVADVAQVRVGVEPAQGVLDWNGGGVAVGGIVVMRQGGNALRTTDAVKAALDALRPALPAGVRVETAYDRSALVRRTLATLRDALVEEALVVVAVVLLFLGHLRSALLPALSLPAAVALALVPLALLDVPATIMSLGGIAIALGATVDAELVMLEACHRRLEAAPAGADRRALLAEAAREVTPAIFYSLLVVAVAFLPVFALDGQAGKLFRPLAWTKTAVMIAAALLSVTFAPALRDLVLRGRIRAEAEDRLSRWTRAIYRPFVEVALRNPRSTVAIGLLAVLSAAPLALELRSEFMPPLDEGDLLYMPTTLPGLSAAEARRQLEAQDRALRAFPEVLSVFGKAGRADTATDPAPLSMVETTIRLAPPSAWRTVQEPRWWSGRAPGWLAPALRAAWPDERRITRAELVAALDRAVRLPGWTGAFTMPIKARLDMLATGVRTAVGVEVLGDDLAGIERAGAALERLLGSIPGARSAVYERSGGGLTLEVTPRRDALARHGLRVADVNRLVAQAVGGETVAVAVPGGRERRAVTVRYPESLRDDPGRLRALLVLVAPAEGPGAAGTAPAGPVAAGHGSPGAHHAEEDVLAGPGAAAARLDATPGGFRPEDPAGTLGWIAPAAVAGAGGPRAVSLGELADVRLVPGPAMIREVDGRLCGTVHVDVDEAARDVETFVSEAQAAVARALDSGALRLERGQTLRWTGQHRLMVETRRRLAVLVPLTVLLAALLLWLHFRSLAEVAIVLLSVPFALVGSVWLMWLLDERVSVASWVGLLALVGLAAQTGVVMIVYIDAAYERRRRAGLIRSPDDVRAAHLEGTVERVRPKLMTVAAMTAGLAPLLWSSGAGAEVMRRIAVPMIGGLVTSAALTLELIPVIYTAWRIEELLAERVAPLDGALARGLAARAAWVRGAAAVVAVALGAALAFPALRAPGAATAVVAAVAAAWAGAGYVAARRAAWALVWPPAAAPGPALTAASR